MEIFMFSEHLKLGIKARATELKKDAQKGGRKKRKKERRKGRKTEETSKEMVEGKRGRNIKEEGEKEGRIVSARFLLNVTSEPAK